MTVIRSGPAVTIDAALIGVVVSPNPQDPALMRRQAGALSADWVHFQSADRAEKRLVLANDPQFPKEAALSGIASGYDSTAELTQLALSHDGLGWNL